MTRPQANRWSRPSSSKRVVRKKSRAWTSQWFQRRSESQQSALPGDLESAVELADRDREHSEKHFIDALVGESGLQPSIIEVRSSKRYLEYLKFRIPSFDCLQYFKLWAEYSEAESNPVARVLDSVPSICRCLRIPGTSMEDMLRALVEDSILNESVFDNEEKLFDGSSMVLTTIGLFSMLYDIDGHGLSTSVTKTQTMRRKKPQLQHKIEGVIISPPSIQQPFLHSLRALDECLPHLEFRAPQTSSGTFGYPNSSNDTLFASNLSLSTLCRTGQLEIIWTTLIGRHFEIDLANSTLSLFALPSACDLFASRDSIFSSISSGLWDDHSDADMFGPQYMREILLSYDLIFSDDRSRKLFRKMHRLDLEESEDVVFDFRLDEICQSSSSGRFLFKETYNKHDDFPLLSARLTIVHDYIERQRPSRVKTLWQDRRNLLSWYTLWAVIALGLAGLLLSILQLLFGVMQTVFAYKAYRLQEGSPIIS